MNWMGGARKRVKISETSRKQREYFEKKRFQTRLERLKDGEGQKPNITQDLVFLETLMKQHDFISAANKENQVTCVDFNSESKRKSAITDIDLPMSPILQPSKLQLDDNEFQQNTDTIQQPQFSGCNSNMSVIFAQDPSPVSEDFQDVQETPRSILMRPGTPHPCKKCDKRVLFQEGITHISRKELPRRLLWDLETVSQMIKKEVDTECNNDCSPIVLNSGNSVSSSDSKSIPREFPSIFIETWQHTNRSDQRAKEQEEMVKEVTEVNSISASHSLESDICGIENSSVSVSNANHNSQIQRYAAKVKTEVPDFDNCELVTISDSDSSPSPPSRSPAVIIENDNSPGIVCVPYVPCKVEITIEEGPDFTHSVLCGKCRRKTTADISTQTEASPMLSVFCQTEAVPLNV